MNTQIVNTQLVKEIAAVINQTRSKIISAADVGIFNARKEQGFKEDFLYNEIILPLLQERVGVRFFHSLSGEGRAEVKSLHS